MVYLMSKEGTLQSPLSILSPVDNKQINNKNNNNTNTTSANANATQVLLQD